jgi:hypothetical protein
MRKRGILGAPSVSVFVLSFISFFISFFLSFFLSFSSFSARLLIMGCDRACQIVRIKAIDSPPLCTNPLNLNESRARARQITQLHSFVSYSAHFCVSTILTNCKPYKFSPPAPCLQLPYFLFT